MRHYCLASSTIRPSAYDAILQAAFDVLSRNPGASLMEVAQRAGVGRATLHRHFQSRDALVSALAKTAIAEMDAVVEAACEGATSHSDAIRLSLQALIPLGDRHGFLAVEPLDDDADLKRDFDRQRKETEDLIDAAKQEGLFDPVVPTAWIVQAFDHLLYAGWESVKAGEATPAQAADLAWRTLTTGLKKASP